MAKVGTKEAARMLGLKNPSSVRQFILSGELKAEKVGRDWLVDTRSIEAFKERRRPPGRPPKDA